jgi:molecular chaperone GrpE
VSEQNEESEMKASENRAEETAEVMAEVKPEPSPNGEDLAEAQAIEAAQEALEDLESKPPESDPEALRARLEEMESQAQEYLDGWQRSRAEFANYRKRVDREQQETYSRASAAVLTRFLTIMDDIERALKDRPAEGDINAWANGIELIYRKFEALLEAEGVEPIEAEGMRFDPNFHEAITHEDNGDFDAGQIIEVIQRGYKKDDRVLRPALVRVAK